MSTTQRIMAMFNVTDTRDLQYSNKFLTLVDELDIQPEEVITGYALSGGQLTLISCTGLYAFEITSIGELVCVSASLVTPIKIKEQENT